MYIVAVFFEKADIVTIWEKGALAALPPSSPHPPPPPPPPPTPPPEIL